jgi:hypothetical protein
MVQVFLFVKDYICAAKLITALFQIHVEEDAKNSYLNRHCEI